MFFSLFNISLKNIKMKIKIIFSIFNIKNIINNIFYIKYRKYNFNFHFNKKIKFEYIYYLSKNKYIIDKKKHNINIMFFLNSKYFHHLRKNINMKLSFSFFNKRKKKLYIGLIRYFITFYNYKKNKFLIYY
jgi:hypothetical protein